MLLAACGGNDREAAREQLRAEGLIADPNRDTIWDLFGGGADNAVTVEVNRYLWRASLEVLDFMPLEAADPFTGILAFGYATPPGGSTAYRATVYISDPALEARSLRVALQDRNGRAISRDNRAPSRGRDPNPRPPAARRRRTPIDPPPMAA